MDITSFLRKSQLNEKMINFPINNPVVKILIGYLYRYPSKYLSSLSFQLKNGERRVIRCGFANTYENVTFKDKDRINGFSFKYDLNHLSKLKFEYHSLLTNHLLNAKSYSELIKSNLIS